MGDIRKELDLEFIKNKLYEGFDYSEVAKDCDLILVLGNTGVGKSTLCNYLLGKKMKTSQTEFEINVIDTDDETSLKIGHSAESETLYAKSICVPMLRTYNGKSMCLLDCPGFNGNRTVESKIIESVSTELAIRKAHEVMGILIVIQYSDFTCTRLNEFRNLVNTLNFLFKDMVEMADQSILIITKWKDNTNATIEDVPKYIKKLLKFCDNKQNSEKTTLSSSDGLSMSDYGKIKAFFTKMLQNTNRILFIDPLDEGFSKQKVFHEICNLVQRKGKIQKAVKIAKDIFKKAVYGQAEREIEEIRPLTISDFNFSTYDKHRALFNEAFCSIILDGVKLMDSIQQELENIQNYVYEIKEHEHKLSLLENQLNNLDYDIKAHREGKSDQAKVSLKSIETWKTLIESKMKDKEYKTRQLINANENIEAIEKRLNEIDNDEPLLFVEKFINESFSWWKIFGWCELKFSARTARPQIPIIKVEREMQNGQWISTEDDRHFGSYKTLYESNFRANPGEASVRAYIKKKDDSENRSEMLLKKGQKEALNSKVSIITSEIEKITLSMEPYENSIAISLSENKNHENLLIESLRKCKEDIEVCKSDVIKFENALEESRHFAIEKFNMLFKNRKYNIVVKINKVFESPSDFTGLFVSQYTLFCNLIIAYQNCVNAGISQRDTFKNYVEKIYGCDNPYFGIIDSVALLLSNLKKGELLQAICAAQDVQCSSLENSHVSKSELLGQSEKTLHQELPFLSSSLSNEMTEELDEKSAEELKKMYEVFKKDIIILEKELELKKNQQKLIEEKLQCAETKM